MKLKKITAIDPGFTESAYVVTDGETLFEFGNVSNEAMIRSVQKRILGLCTASQATFGRL
jgi:hypothetical protein